MLQRSASDLGAQTPGGAVSRQELVWVHQGAVHSHGLLLRMTDTAGCSWPVAGRTDATFGLMVAWSSCKGCTLLGAVILAAEGGSLSNERGQIASRVLRQLHHPLCSQQIHSGRACGTAVPVPPDWNVEKIMSRNVLLLASTSAAGARMAGLAAGRISEVAVPMHEYQQ